MSEVKLAVPCKAVPCKAYYTIPVKVDPRAGGGLS